MNFVLSGTILGILGIIILCRADAQDTNAAEIIFDYLEKSVEDAPIELGTEPENNNNSIKYPLYTPSNPKQACFIEPTPEEFDKCSFNASYKTIILTHGFLVTLQPGNLFEELKDALLDHNPYNVIIVNWTLYNNYPLTKVIDNIPKVGKKVAELLYFVMNHTGTDQSQFHCIGHSYGAHVCGHAARQFSNFSRVTGLDPGTLLFYRFFEKDLSLNHTDAYYVDAIHTSTVLSGNGLGILRPIGDMDFYVNGGVIQKHCKPGREYRNFKGETSKVVTVFDSKFCNHFIVIEYFINSVRPDCQFLANKCSNFLSAILNSIVKTCPSNSSVTAKMGFHSERIQGLPPRTSFYVETLEFQPYCKNHK